MKPSSKRVAFTALSTASSCNPGSCSLRTTVLSSEHVGGRISVEEPLHAEPAHDPASRAFGEGYEVCGRDRPCREKLCGVGSRSSSRWERESMSAATPARRCLTNTDSPARDGACRPEPS